MAEQAFIGCADGVALSTASTAWYAPLGSGPAPGTIAITTEANVEHIHRGATVTLKRLYVRVQTNGRSTASTVTIRKNGSGTSLAVSIGAGVTGTVSDLSNTVTLNAGDTYCVEVATGTGTGNLLIPGITLSMEASGQCIFPVTSAGSQSFVNANVTRHQTSVGPLAGVQTTESIVQTKALVAGVLSNLQIYATANGSTNATTAKNRINATDGTLSVSVSAGATGRTEDTTDTDSIAADDLYNTALVSGAGTASFTHSFIGYTFTPSSARKSQINSRTATSVLAASTTRYGQIMGRCAFNSTEGNVQIVAPFDCRLSKLTAKVSANASTTTTTVRLRVGGASVNNTLSITAGATGQITDGSSTDVVPAGSLINVIASGSDGSVTFQGFSLLVEEIVSYSLAAAAGAFSLTGQDVGYARTRVITAGAGGFTLSGQTVRLLQAHRLSAAAGAFTLSGQAVALRAGRKVVAGVGSVSLTGQAVNLRAVRKLTAAAGAFSLTGIDVILRRGRSLVAAAGAFGLTGQDAGFKRALRLVAGAAGYVLTGRDASLLYARKIGAAAGGFSLTGQDVSLRRGRILGAGVGSFTLTGRDVGLKRAARLTGGAGAFTFTGNSAGLPVSRRIAADVAAFTLAGQDVALTIDGSGAATASFAFPASVSADPAQRVYSERGMRVTR